MRYRIVIVIVIAFAFSSGTAAAATYKNLAFRHGNVSFEMKLTPRRLEMQDRYGTRTIARAKCNERVVQAYWKDLSKHVAKLKPQDKTRQLASLSKNGLAAATLRADDHQHTLILFDPELRYFDRVVGNSHGVFIDELRACRGKK